MIEMNPDTFYPQPAIPWTPQTSSEMRSRFEAAINHVHDIDEAIRNPDLAPSKSRAHVFDFEDGLRLIISVDSDNVETLLHVSGSTFPDSRLTKQLKEMQVNSVAEFYSAFRSVMQGSLAMISSLDELQLIDDMSQCVTEKGVLHLFYRWRDRRGK